jgi:hypothetical protein
MGDEQKTFYDQNFGLASSGGGIRSCSFASGVLCALLDSELLKKRNGGERNKYIPSGLPKYMSCVSGGGYMGSSFLSWARIHAGNPRDWASTYFDNMKLKVGYYVSYEQGVLRAIQDLVFMAASLTTMFSVALALNTPLGVFIAVALNYAVGDLLVQEAEKKETRTVFFTCFFIALSLMILRSFAQRCLVVPTTAESSAEKQPEGAASENTPLLGSINHDDPAFAANFDPTSTNLKTVRMMLGDVVMAFLMFAMILNLTVFIATIIYYARTNLESEEGELILLGMTILVLLFHFMAGKLINASQSLGGLSIGYFLIFWLYAEFANDKIYGHLLREADLGGFSLEAWFPTVQLIAAVVMLLNPLLFYLQTTTIPFYSISRLTNAFYERSIQPGYCNCKAITGNYAPNETMYGDDQPQDNLPVYIACTTANSWRISKTNADIAKAQSGEVDLPGAYDIYAVSSDRKTLRLETGMSPWDPNPKVSEKTSPHPLVNNDTPLSYLMGLSAAAGALQNGEYQSTFSQLGISNLQLFLGASMGGFYFPYRKDGHVFDQPWFVFLIQMVVQGVIFGPLLYGSVLFFQHEDSTGDPFIALSILLWILVFSFSSLLDVCDVESVRFIAGGTQFRILAQQVAWNTHAPEILYLSDGGHTENLALLPLLARRLPVIIIADGSADVDPVAGIREALKQARGKLGVTFEPSRKDQLRRMGNKDDKEWDLESDLVQFGKDLFENKSRAFVIKARYHTAPYEASMIIFLHPNPYNKHGPGSDPCHKSDQLDGYEKGEEGLECGCSSACCSLVSCRSCCGSFPMVSTGNQFFTPNLWLKMHQQGFAAASEALDILAARRED